MDYVKYEGDYFEIPVLARVTLIEGPLMPYIVLGPSLGFQLNATGKSVEVNDETDVSGETKDIDFSLVAGAGMELDFEDFSLLGQVMYSHGLTNIDNSDVFFDITDEIYTRNIGIMVGISFPIDNSNK